MEYIIALLFVPILIIVISRFYFKNTISNKESFIQLGISIILASILYFLSTTSLKSDFEILNGKITGKEKVKVSCSHSYKCHCRTVTTTSYSNGRTTRHTRTKCKTCYRHYYDYDWRVYSTLGNFEISRINSQGTYEPPRWTQVYIAEPISKEHSYDNYVKAAKLSLFNEDINDQKWIKMLPNYPRVYDYNKINRVISIGVSIPNINDINQKLNLVLRDMGARKQVNIVLIFVNADQEYRYILERHWIGGKKNDVIVLIGVKSYPQINWADVITFARNKNNELLHVRLRDDLIQLRDVADTDKLVDVISFNIESNYNRISMKEFEYLNRSIQPSTNAFVICLLILIMVNGGLSYYFHKNKI